MDKMIPPQVIGLQELPLVKRAKRRGVLLSLTLELTQRCNNDCVHCYICKSANNKKVEKSELSFKEIQKIVDQAYDMGTLWMLLSGGEPLLRKDFSDIYLYLKHKGFLVSIFTNASLISKNHVRLFKQYPPRDIEVTIYGATEAVHRKVTRSKTFTDTMKGIEMLLKNDIPFTLKTTVMKSNYSEFPRIARFCEKKSKRPFRFDPFLVLRLDGDKKRNQLIIKERLNPEEIIAIEVSDSKRVSAIERQCILPENRLSDGSLFKCQAGLNAACIDSFGIFKLCSTLVAPGFTYDLRKGDLKEAWDIFATKIRNKKSSSIEFKTSCGSCKMIDLCSWCPAHSYLETGNIDRPTPYFCMTATKRYSFFKKDMP